VRQLQPPPLAVLVRGGATLAASLVALTLAVAVLEEIGIEDGSPVYLVAVVVSAVVGGTWTAIAAAIGSFLVYNFLFTEPTRTFTISDPNDLLSVVLLLFTGVVVGQLAAAQRNRAEAALEREREARALFRVSRVLATRESTVDALSRIATALRDETGMTRVWIGIGPDPVSERVVADTGGGPARASAARLRVLQRRPGDEPAVWSLVHQSTGPNRRPPGGDRYRVRVEASGEALGSIWADRARSAREPTRVQSRLLAATADQIGQALARDRVAEASRRAEVARQGDELKTALLQSVSHDFRTPLAVIRAAAGSMDAPESSPDDRHANAVAIEREVEYLNGLVANLLDLSRIEAGALRADRELYELDDVVRGSIDRLRPRLAPRPVEVAVEPVVVRVDGVFLDAAVTNLLENARKYSGVDVPIRVSSRVLDASTVRLTIEDGGAGVPDAAIPRLFEKFFRVPGAQGGSRGGLGIGLAVVKGLVEATGGRVSARRSELGGLAVDIDLSLGADGLGPSGDDAPDTHPDLDPGAEATG
jgi:two-component system sensor histidine kinase KdpD